MIRRLFLLTFVLVLSSVGLAQADSSFSLNPTGPFGTPSDPIRLLKTYGHIDTTLTLDAVSGGDAFTSGKVGSKQADSPNKAVTATFVTPTQLTFDSIGDHGTVRLQTSAAGLFSNSAFNIGTTLAGKPGVLAPLIKNGPKASVEISYSINSLEQRKLKLTKGFIKFGDVLKGTKISSAAYDSYVLSTTNKAEVMGSITNVVLKTPGGTSNPYFLTQVNATEKKPDLPSITGPLWITETPITTVDPDNRDTRIQLQGIFNTYTDVGATGIKPWKITDKLITVASTEGPSVGDSVAAGAKAYASPKLGYSANVGAAKLSQAKPGKFNATDPMHDFGDQTKIKAGSGKILGTLVAEGQQIANFDPLHSDVDHTFSLSSRVVQKGTLAEKSAVPGKYKDGDKTTVTNVYYIQDPRKPLGIYKMVNKPNLSNLFKAVGSEAEIVSSYYAGTGASPEGDVTMQWRARTAKEAHMLLPDKSVGLLPAVWPTDGPRWLTSDVVRIGGTALTNDVYYALQMTFDNRINLAFDGPVDGTIDNEWRQMFIGKLGDGEDGKWAPAGDLAKGHYGNVAAGGDGFESLDDFLTASLVDGTTLEDLVGNWGVDKDAQKSWVIVKGGGIFAVVPEPTAILMLVSATLGAMTYGWRRFSRKGELTA
jgi:hypothetical protein